MNVNVKISLTDEERNRMFQRLTGKTTKGMVTRADVNAWVRQQLETFLTTGTTAQAEPVEDLEPIQRLPDLTAEDVEMVLRQNELLHSRVNRLQYLLDTKG